MKQGWVKKKLGEIGKASMCKRIFKNETLVDGEIPFYKIGTFGKEPNAFISKDLYNEYREKYRFPKKGDVLISASGTIGRTVIYDGEPAYFQDSNIVWIDNNEKSVTNMFLFALYKSVNWGESKGTTIKRLYNSNLEEIEIHYPESFEEQKRIVAKLDQCFEAIDKARANAAKNLENAKELFQSKLNEIFSKKGEGWVEKKLGDVCNKITDGSHNPPKKKDQGLMMLSGRNVTESGLDFTKVRYISSKDFNSENKRTDIQSGDVLLTIVGTIGRSVVYPKSAPKVVFQRSVAVIKPQDVINSYFLSYAFDCSKYQKLLKDKSRGVAQKGIYLKTIRNLPIEMPSITEQESIVNQLNIFKEQAQSLESKYQQELNSLEELKKSILQKAFEGEL